MGLFWDSILAFFAAVGVVQTAHWAWRRLWRRRGKEK
jgi:hypothetical protein